MEDYKNQNKNMQESFSYISFIYFFTVFSVFSTKFSKLVWKAIERLFDCTLRLWLVVDEVSWLWAVAAEEKYIHKISIEQQPTIPHRLGA